MEQGKSHKKLFHGICFHKIFLSKGRANNLVSEKQDRTILLKYFPKHIANLHFKFSDGSLNTRIKHLKLITKLSCEKNLHKDFWRVILANKLKTVELFERKQYYYEKKYTKLDSQFLNMFPNTRKITISPSEKLSPKDLHWMLRTYCYLNNLNHLKSLRVDIPNQAPFQLLSKLRYSLRVLSHLKVFRIDLSLLGHQNSAFLQKFLTYKEILKYVTDLCLDRLIDKDSFETFLLLPQYCPRLSILYFGTSQEPSQGETTYLNSLKNFNNLQELYLCTKQTLDLLKNCTFPKSLRLLGLSFSEIDWKKFIENPSSLVAFDDQPENLQNLEVLDIQFADKPQDKGQFSHNHHLAIEIFLQDLLKKVPTCKELNLTLSCYYLYDYKFKTSPFLFDFSRFLKSIDHLRQSLEVLNISDKSRNYLLADFKTQPVVFPKLSSLSIFTEIPPFTEFENIVSVVQVKESKNPVLFDGIKVESCEALLKFLKRLGEMKNLASTDKRVEIVVYAKDLEADEEYFEKNYEDMKKDIEGVKNIFLLIKIRRSKFKFIKELESFQPLFGDLKVNKSLY